MFKEYKYFKVFVILTTLWFFFIMCKNYYIVNKNPKLNFEIIEINKNYERHSFRSEAIVKINNEIYTFEVHPHNYDVFKKTGKVDFNIYKDFILNKYITTSDYIFSRNLFFLLVGLNFILFAVNYQQKFRGWVEKKL